MQKLNNTYLFHLLKFNFRSLSFLACGGFFLVIGLAFIYILVYISKNFNNLYYKIYKIKVI